MTMLHGSAVSADIVTRMHSYVSYGFFCTHNKMLRTSDNLLSNLLVGRCCFVGMVDSFEWRWPNLDGILSVLNYIRIDDESGLVVPGGAYT